MRMIEALKFWLFVILCVGYPGQHRAKVAELSKFGRPVSVLVHILIVPVIFVQFLFLRNTILRRDPQR
jgi:hypothetical protein